MWSITMLSSYKAFSKWQQTLLFTETFLLPYKFSDHEAHNANDSSHF